MVDGGGSKSSKVTWSTVVGDGRQGRVAASRDRTAHVRFVSAILRRVVEYEARERRAVS